MTVEVLVEEMEAEAESEEAEESFLQPASKEREVRTRSTTFLRFICKTYWFLGFFG